MASLPCPFKGSSRFVVDSEGVATDKRQEFLQYVVSKMFAESLLLWGTGGLPPSRDFWRFDERPASEAADAFGYATKPFTYTEFVTVDEAPGFDEKALDNLISDRLKAQREARERLIFEEQRYNGNPDCLIGVEGCTCGLPRDWDGR